jgi:hypothetical protein
MVSTKLFNNDGKFHGVEKNNFWILKKTVYICNPLKRKFH